jgi:hypothetical protein
MSVGSAASNLGYGNINPYNSSPYVNGTSSNYSGSFSSNEIPGTPPGPLPGLAGAKSNVDAAAGKVPGICMKGGSKTLKRKIKNITKYYKRMKAGSRKIESLKRRLRNRAASRRCVAGGKRGYKKSFAGSRRFAGSRCSSRFAGSRSRFAGSRRRYKKSFAGSRRRYKKSFAGSKQHGGYSQYQNNLPMTPAYQVAGVPLPASQLGLANPPPYVKLSNDTSCIDNYNHYTNQGFPSKGH